MHAVNDLQRSDLSFLCGIGTINNKAMHLTRVLLFADSTKRTMTTIIKGEATYLHLAHIYVCLDLIQFNNRRRP